MAKAIPIEELEVGIRKFYERYSARKVALATFIVGVFTFGLSYVFYALSGMGLVAILVSGIAGFLSVNLTMIFVVPPSKKLADSRQLICEAIRDPSRIQVIDDKGVKLADENGDVRALTGLELEVWTSKVVPYFMQTQSAGQSAVKARSERKLTTSERKYIEERRREVLKIEKQIDEKRKELEKERKEIERSTAELRELERAAAEKKSQLESGSGDGLE